MTKKLALMMALAWAGMAHGAAAAEVNLYTARHYESDRQLYDAFTTATGIKVNLKEGKPEELLQLIVAQKDRSPADIFMTADAGNLWRAEKAGVLAEVNSPILTSKIPANYRDPGNKWFGFAMRARVIFVRTDRLQVLPINSYDDLADPRRRGTLCIRQSSNIYNLSLLAARISHEGSAKAEAWAKGAAANFARDPKGNDTDQLLALAAGECQVAVANHYYYLRLKTDKDPAKKEAAAKIEPLFTDQDGRGVHINITGAAALASAPNRAAAIQFLEFMVSERAQNYFAEGNFEFPVVETTPRPAILKALGAFKADLINMRAYGEKQAEAQQIYDRAGWK